VQYVEEVESYTVDRSIASTELDKNKFSIKEKIEKEGVNWII
jgi:hypothetical protein